MEGGKEDSNKDDKTDQHQFLMNLDQFITVDPQEGDKKEESNVEADIYE